ncbi:hypothetical protein FA95DRAFT_1681324 [Auriscalpium vulgare]|uniref:Uncharacterized protein n=1 Tax=Auriscalpium vulgare TaxID=40419 RepID=A0ACB8RK79_9AGAM|nr:hypothetical protein FA95DRAFT_1681324 [Auriscalpium vulgare]
MLNVNGLKKPRSASTSATRAGDDRAPSRGPTQRSWSPQLQGAPSHPAMQTSLSISPFGSRNPMGAPFTFKAPSLPSAKSAEHSVDQKAAHIPSSDSGLRLPRERSVNLSNPSHRLSIDAFAPGRLRHSSTSLESIPEAEDSGYFSTPSDSKMSDEQLPYTHFAPTRTSSLAAPSAENGPTLKHPSPKRPAEAFETEEADMLTASASHKRIRSSLSSHDTYPYPADDAPADRYTGDASPRSSYNPQEPTEDAYTQVPSFFNKNASNVTPLRSAAQSVPPSHALGGVLGLELSDADLARYTELHETACKKWTEATLEQWHAGADELTAKFGQMLNMAKDHMTEKMNIYSTLHRKLSDHRAALSTRTESLRGAQGALVRDSTSVIGSARLQVVQGEMGN